MKINIFSKRLALLLLLLSVGIGEAGCYYTGTAAYAGPGPYPGPYYGGPGYAGSTSVAIAVQDRPYYTHGAGYYVGRTYYAWRPGHWSRRGHRWIPGHYVLIRRG